MTSHNVAAMLDLGNFVKLFFTTAPSQVLLMAMKSVPLGGSFGSTTLTFVFGVTL